MAIGKILSPTTWYNGLVAASQWFQNVQDNINAFFDATATFKGLVIDGTGGNTFPSRSLLTISGGAHICAFPTPSPSISAGAGAGTGPTVSIIGSDTSGLVTVTTGTMPSGLSIVATVTLSSTVSTSFSNGPIAFLQPVNSNAAALSGNGQVYIGSQTQSGGDWTGWRINVGSSALAGSTTYNWFYWVIF